MFSWLQLSDLHIFESTGWNLMLDSYTKLAEVVRPNFIVVTGDYRHILKNSSYDNALKFLNQIVEIFNVKKQDIFIVPGNHDVNDYSCREEIVTTIRTTIENNVDAYLKYMSNGPLSLTNAFKEYIKFIQDFYGDEVDDKRVKTPADVISIPWNNKVNIAMLNTALISDDTRDRKEIVDINTFSKINIDKSLPTIVIAHHDIKSLASSHREMAAQILNLLDAKAYLCGDEHRLNRSSIEKYNIPNTMMPIIICGKSAVETDDSYSDLAVIEYKCEDDGYAYVQVYKYENKGFVESNMFYYNVNKRYRFKMFDVTNKKKDSKSDSEDSSATDDSKALRINRIDNTPVSIWLPDAELATGKQTRFNSFTETDSIKKYFDNDCGYLGIASVKGIGKTFVLQVKRINSSRKYYCLPVCNNPSVRNNWATESVTFRTYAELRTDDTYNDLILLWKNAIKCYVINHLTTEDDSVVDEYLENGKINDSIADLCTDHVNSDLDAILNNIISINNWSRELADNDLEISNMCRVILSLRKKLGRNRRITRPIAIFIDKVDQSIIQTNAEPPADCVVCKKSNNYSECNSLHKDLSYCSSDSGCQSKNCCYGCEVFAGSNSSDGLRIYENSNAAKRVHVNIWQYLQLALMTAATQISDEYKGDINVFYTMRQEAFNCEESLLGEQNQKITGKVIRLSYTKIEHKKIFLDCIKNQNDAYLYDPHLKNKDGFQEYAFVDLILHPYYPFLS